MSSTPLRIGGPAPFRGEHTREVLMAAGYTDEDIVQLKRDGAFGSISVWPIQNLISVGPGHLIKTLEKYEYR